MSTLLIAVFIRIAVHDLPSSFGFELNVLSHHIFSVLHCNSIESVWFSLLIHASPLTEEICMQSSLDTRISLFPPPVSAQSASALKNKHFNQESFRFLVLDAF